MICNDFILNGEDISVDNSGTIQLRPQLLAENAQLGIEFLGSIVEGYETTILVEIAVIFPWQRKLLRQAPQRTGVVDPKVFATATIQSLHSGEARSSHHSNRQSSLKMT